MSTITLGEFKGKTFVLGTVKMTTNKSEMGLTDCVHLYATDRHGYIIELGRQDDPSPRQVNLLRDLMRRMNIAE